MEEDPAHSIQVTITEALSDRFHFEMSAISQLTRFFLNKLHLPEWSVDISVVDEPTMSATNLQWRGKDQPTDVLSFPQHEFSHPQNLGSSRPTDTWESHLGDIMLSPDVALRQAQNIGHGLDREVAFLLVHGILHLCGHDHKEPEEERTMISLQKELLRLAEVPKPLWDGIVLSKTPIGVPET